MGLGPHPVARARRGLRNCKAAPLGFPPQGARGCPVARAQRARSGGAEGAQRPLKKRPHRLEATKSGYYMSGVGAPATRPRPCRAGP
eukprot:gene20480-biopygen20603